MDRRPHQCHPSTPTPRPGRFLNEAFAEIAAARRLSYEERFGGWLVRVGNGGRYLEAYGYQLSLNSAVSASVARDKAACAARLTDEGLPSVPTYLLLDNVRQEWFDGRRPVAAVNDILGNIRLPVIVKPNEGSSGTDITLCRTQADARTAALRMIERHPSVAIQPMLDLTSEERWVVVDGSPVLRYAKLPVIRESGVPLFNLTLGATAKQIGVDEGVSETRSLAIRSAEALALRIAAIDIVWTADEIPLVLEVNSGLSFEYFSQQGIEQKRAAINVYDTVVAAALQ